MDDIIKMVRDKAHISDDAAKSAVSTVLTFLKGKLPGPVASQIDGIVGGMSGGISGNKTGGSFTGRE